LADWCPVGFVPVSEVVELLRTQWNAWSSQPTFPYLDFPADFWSSPSPDRGALQVSLAAVIGPMLAAGPLRASGICIETGDWYWLPPSTWRLPWRSSPSRRVGSAIEAAFQGWEIPVPPPAVGAPLCIAVIAERDFADALGIRSDLPEPPDVTPRVLEGMPVPKLHPLVAMPNAGGRPPKHDWEAFWIQVAHYSAINDLHPDQRPELQNHMESWTAEEWLEPPDPATIRNKLARLYNGRLTACNRDPSALTRLRAAGGTTR